MKKTDVDNSANASSGTMPIRLQDYPTGSRVSIDGRIFQKLALGSLWSEDTASSEAAPHACAVLLALEVASKVDHQVLRIGPGPIEGAGPEKAPT